MQLTPKRETRFKKAGDNPAQPLSSNSLSMSPRRSANLLPLLMLGPPSPQFTTCAPWAKTHCRDSSLPRAQRALAFSSANELYGPTRRKLSRSPCTISQMLSDLRHPRCTVKRITTNRLENAAKPAEVSTRVTICEVEPRGHSRCSYPYELCVAGMRMHEKYERLE